jgi:hypothetical protein
MPLLLDSKYDDVKILEKEPLVLLELTSDIVDCSWYELELDVSILELGSVDGRTVYNELVSVRVVEVLN